MRNGVLEGKSSKRQRPAVLPLRRKEIFLPRLRRRAKFFESAITRELPANRTLGSLGMVAGSVLWLFPITAEKGYRKVAGHATWPYHALPADVVSRPEPLCHDSQFNRVVGRMHQVLLRSQVSLCRLHRSVAQQHLNLFKLAACCPT